MSDIVERLREGESEGVDGWWYIMAEAAEEITRLRKENKKMRKALIEIQCKSHDILRPIPFQEDEDEV